MLAAVTLPPYRTGMRDPPSGTPMRAEGRPDRVGHRGGVGAARVAAGPDRPDRLVGDDEVAEVRGVGRPAGGQRPAQLGVDDRLRPTGLAVRQLLADAQDRPQARLDAPGRACGAMSSSVSPASRAPLGVADDDPRRQSHEHRCAHLAGVRAGGFLVDVLGTDGDAGPGERVADRRQGTRTAGR